MHSKRSGSSARLAWSNAASCRAGHNASPAARGSIAEGGVVLSASKLSASQPSADTRARSSHARSSTTGSRCRSIPIRSSSCQRVKTSSSRESLCIRVRTTEVYHSQQFSRTSGELASSASLYKSSRMKQSTRLPVSEPSRPTDSRLPSRPTISTSSAVRMYSGGFEPRLIVVSGKSSPYSAEQRMRCTRRLNFDASDAE